MGRAATGETPLLLMGRLDGSMDFLFLLVDSFAGGCNVR